MAGVAASLGRGAMTNHFNDYINSDVILIMGTNPSENHPIAMKWILQAQEKGAKVIVVDPRMNKSAAHADLFVRLRPGTDIAFLNGLIHYILQNHLYLKEYITQYTNAGYLIHPDYSFEDGLFSGLVEENGKRSYQKDTWQYQRDGETLAQDQTLQHPQCVLQLMRQHMSRYDLATVSKVTGVAEKTLQQAYETFAASGKAHKAGNILWAMGITQSTHGTQNVRAINIIQLLLGNIGVAGGGANAHRGESNVQGSTDMGLLSHNLAGYLNVPTAHKHLDLAAYLAEETPNAGYWTNKPKFLISMMKAWFGPAATLENDFCYQWLPKHDGQNRYHVGIFEKMAQGQVKVCLPGGKIPPWEDPWPGPRGKPWSNWIGW